MKLVIFGLTISSAWGNGHATLWRGLCRALAQRGHEVTFFERDVPYYAENRDMPNPPGCRLRLYDRWEDIEDESRREANGATVAMVTSYCPDARAACRVVIDSQADVRAFYDLDTPVTLSHLNSGQSVPYVPDEGFADFDLVLSYTGGRALTELQTRLGARRVAPLFGSVDPDAHRPVPVDQARRADLSYLGTYAADRQRRLEELFVEPARRRPARRFVLGGSQYPADFPWTPNMFYVWHTPPPAHPTFYSSSLLTLNVTRGAMAAMGYCPSGRMFEAAACGAPVLSDEWEGLDTFFAPGEEILIARTTQDALDALELSPSELARVAEAARERTLASHTATSRVLELEKILASVA